MTSEIARIVGPINYDSLSKFLDDIEHLERDHATVVVELASEGGDTYAALAIAARIKNSSRRVVVKAYGLVASAAVIILAAGRTRHMDSSAWVMVHEESEELSGSVVDLERESTHLRRMEDQWTSLLAGYTKTSAAKWTELHKQTTYLSAKECLALGLIDRII